MGIDIFFLLNSACVTLFWPHKDSLKTPRGLGPFDKHSGRTMPPESYPFSPYLNGPGFLSKITEQVVRFRIQNWWFLENPNYYPIQLTNLNVQAYRLNEVSDTSNVTGILKSQSIKS